MFDSAPITKVKHDDPRTGRFLKLFAAWTAFVGGPGLIDSERPDFDPIRQMAMATAERYGARDFDEADRTFLKLSNLVARHPRATPTIAKWRELWKLAKDPDASAAALERLQQATTDDGRRFGSSHEQDR